MNDYFLWFSPYKPLTLKEARDCEAKVYLKDKQCKNKHYSFRRVKGNTCLACERIKLTSTKYLINHKKWVKRNPEKIKEYSKSYRERFPEKSKESNRKFKEKFPEYKKQYELRTNYNKKYREKNRNRLNEEEKRRYAENRFNRRTRKIERRKENLASDAAKSAERRALKKQATPSWLTPFHKAMIKVFYRKAQLKKNRTGVNYHVDHIIPLKGKYVCGLHVPWNLQVLTSLENMAKGNKV